MDMQELQSSEPFNLRLLAQLPAIDLYGPVHKGLRLELGRTLAELGHCDSSDASGRRAALTELERALHLCEVHGRKEDEHIMPAVAARHAAAAQCFASVHERLEHAVAGLRAQSRALDTAAPEALPGLWRLLYLRYAAFVADNFTHMGEEEEVLLPLLESLYSADELAAIQRKLVASITPDEALAFGPVMLAAATERERTQMLAAQKHGSAGGDARYGQP